MVIKVRDIKVLKSGIYGYCPCGRELKKGSEPDIKCPLCERTLSWGGGNDGNKEREVFDTDGE